MLKSTKELLKLGRIYLEELGYSYHTEDEVIDLDKIFDGAVYCISHSKSFNDALEAIKMYRYLDKNIKKIVDVINKYPNYFDSLEHGKNEILSLVDDEECAGTYHVTNALDTKGESLLFIGDTEEDSGDFIYENSKYSLYGGASDYFIRFSKLNKEKMVLLNRDGEKLAIISIDSEAKMVLDNNYTDYDIEHYNDVALFYRKGRKKTEDNFEALMYWNILSEKNPLGLARLEMYNEDANLELISLLSLACLLIIRRMLGSSSSAVGLLAALSAMNIVRH